MAPRLASLPLVLILSLLALAPAALIWGDDAAGSAPRKSVVLASFGDASISVSVLSSSGPPSVDVDDAFIDLSAPAVSGAPNGFSNYTYTFALTGDVGVTDYSFAVGDDTLDGSLVVAGFVIKDDGAIVSGDDGKGVTVGQQGKFTYDVKAVGVDGSNVDLSKTTYDARPDSGVYMEEVDRSSTGFTSDSFVLSINKLRVGSGRFLLSFEAPAIEYRGEVFETVLHVMQNTDPEPPCVVNGASLVSKAGVVEVAMFNILTPPKASPVSEIVLSIAGKSVSFSSWSSSIKLPTSKVVFDGVSGVGPAEITCDGETAVVLENGKESSDGLVVVSGGSAGPLAVDELLSDYPSSDSESLITAIVRVVDSSPSQLLVSEANVIMNKFCEVTKASKCNLKGVTLGSAVMEMGGLVPDVDAASQDLQESFSTCAFQTDTGYGCDKLQLGELKVVNAVAATAAAAGIATWTIVLIAVVGAIGLVALISLTAWAVHRRAAIRESESSYSSSGPLGVPDPSDLLYEQSIVRDIYGRGEDGGPSPQAAIAAERMAAEREEFPRPPSSSGLSRGNRSSDASSTYSV